MQTIESLQNRIEELKAALQVAYEYIEEHVDVVDGPDGPEGNRAMYVCMYLTEILDK